VRDNFILKGEGAEQKVKLLPCSFRQDLRAPEGSGSHNF
jgi:hypothetical protein